MIAQRPLVAGKIVDAAIVALKIMVSAASVHASGQWRSVAGPTRIIGFGMLRIQWRPTLGRQGVRPSGVGGIHRGGKSRFKLIQRRPLTDRRFGGIVALQERIALHFLLDEGVHFDIGKLQKLDRLTQLRRHDECLALA